MKHYKLNCYTMVLTCEIPMLRAHHMTWTKSACIPTQVVYPDFPGYACVSVDPYASTLKEYDIKEHEHAACHILT